MLHSKAPSTIGNMFPFKDKTRDTPIQSLVVYKINCATCQAEYIGKMQRILAIRMKEHPKTPSQHAINTLLKTPVIKWITAESR